MRKKIAVLFGGKSPEHKISLLSARSVIDNLDTSLYDKVLIGIDDMGQWHYYGSSITFENEGSPTSVQLPQGGIPVVLAQDYGGGGLYRKSTGELLAHISAAFPVLHGMYGEDGAVQGLLRLAGIPYVGCDTLGSAVCMDKDVAKRLLRDAGVGVADFVTMRKGYRHNPDYDTVVARLGTDLYIKPVNLGSSVGVSYATDTSSYQEALAEAFRFDKKVIVEEKVNGREIECAVLGNENPKASVIGEIAPTADFYSFESKYVDKEDAKLSIPADISQESSDEARALALKVFTTLECSGFARVDMFLKTDGQLIVNEVNTIPGFTNISMYPKLWEHTGIPYKSLLTELISLGVARHEKLTKLDI